MEDLTKRLNDKREDANLLDKHRVQKDRDKGSGVGGTIDRVVLSEAMV